MICGVQADRFPLSNRVQWPFCHGGGRDQQINSAVSIIVIIKGRWRDGRTRLRTPVLPRVCLRTPQITSWTPQITTDHRTLTWTLTLTQPEPFICDDLRCSGRPVSAVQLSTVTILPRRRTWSENKLGGINHRNYQGSWSQWRVKGPATWPLGRLQHWCM